MKIKYHETVEKVFIRCFQSALYFWKKKQTITSTFFRKTTLLTSNWSNSNIAAFLIFLEPQILQDGVERSKCRTLSI